MFKTTIRIILIAGIALVAAGGPAAQEGPSDDPRATGLIPLDARQLAEIEATWERVNRVGLSPLGFERVNRVRAEKGKPALDPSIVRPAGEEIDAAPAGRGASVLAAAANLDMASDLPVSVDNSLLRFFPPIRNQGSLGSCASFASTYYHLSYMTAFQRNLDIRTPGTTRTSTRRSGPTTWSTTAKTRDRVSMATIRSSKGTAPRPGPISPTMRTTRPGA